MTLLRTEGLSLEIHGAPILRDVSLALAPGRVLGVIGESGSGKSMTALAVMGLLPGGARATGRVLLDGRELLGRPERDLCAIRGRDIGMVFQEPMTALNPLQDIGTQVAETVRRHERIPRRAARARAAEALRRAELPPERFPLSRFPHELSGGQRQRVVIAMAIALRPKLLIADEPTTALDVTTQAQILALLKRLVREDGMALMLISHDLAVVADMADDIAIMRHGRIVEQGPAGQLFRDLRHPYSRALLAASGHVPARGRGGVGPGDSVGPGDGVGPGHGAPPAAAGDTRPGPAPLLELRDVHRSYRLPARRLFGPRPEVAAVRGVSFTLHRGESLGLVGESGCGKSTLTRAILGLEEVQGGEILLDGHPMGPGAGADQRRRLQVVFQDPHGSFNPRHRVARLVAEPFHLAPGTPRAARAAAVAEALEAVGLSATDGARYIHEFSGGQRQRIAIARALITRPDLILLDEAVSALDVRVRAQILDLLADLSGRFGLSYLFISHDLSVVRAVTDRVLVMQAGEIVEAGPTEQVFAAPRHAHTRRLLAAAPHLPAQDERALSRDGAR